VNAFAQIGAFPFRSASSRDAALLRSEGDSLLPGSYQLQIRDGANAGGNLIAEIYDATSASAFVATTPRLISASVRKQLGSAEALNVGFAIAGATAKTILLRAIGPSLSAEPFKLSSAMFSPTITIVDTATGTALVWNSGWAGDSQLVEAARQAGAYPVTNAMSRDSMLLITLAPGNYVAQVRPEKFTDGGTVLVDLHEVP
jgi:hypothetical protein